MSGTKGITAFKSALQAAALMGVSSLALGGQAQAQSLSDAATTALMQASDLSGVTVEGQTQRLESPRYAAPVLDTPQTITVVDARVMEQQNLLGLRDVLSTLPGITFGAGEGGGGYGDSINLRGYSANNDIGTDGVRDSAQYSRTDPFNLDQIEVTNGANSVYGGAGAVGGTINLISKRAQGTNRTAISIGAGTDAYGRVTADTDRQITDGVALRLNVMMHENDVAGRDVERFSRWGFAPSLAFGLGSPTVVTLNYLHQEDDNIPQYGVPFAINAFNPGGLVNGANAERYYGWRNLDRQLIEVDQLTAIIDHAINENLSLRNLTRAQQVEQDAVITNIGGTTCMPNGINAYTGAACAPAGTRNFGANGTTNFRNSFNELLYNQTDLTAEFTTGGWEHTLVAGVALTQENYDLDNGSPLYNANGTRPAIPNQSLANPDSLWTGPVNFIRTGHTEAELENQALYVFDAIELTDQWELNGGVRFERNETTALIQTFSPTTGAVTATTRTVNEDDLLSYRVGLVFKPIENASIYAAYGNSERPAQVSVVVGGGCTVTSCNADPEEAENYEVGVKWDTMDGALSLTAALFRNERSAFLVPSAIAGETDRLEGASRVDGIALGASGLITENWSVFANYTFLESELLQDVANALLATSFRRGDPLPNTPEQSFSVWTTYEPVHGLLLGYGATYQGEFTFSRPAAGAPLAYTDAYWVHRAMVSYGVTDNLALQLNVNNIFDEEYYTRVRNNTGNGWATPGEGRSFVLSANLRY